MGPTLKGGDIELVSIDGPTEPVAPQSGVDFEITIRNHAQLIFNDADSCQLSGECSTPDFDGYCTKTVLEMPHDNWATPEGFRIDCIPMAEISPPNEVIVTLTVAVPPEAGEYDVGVHLETTETQVSSGSISTTVTVSAGNDNEEPDETPSDETRLKLALLFGAAIAVGFAGRRKS